MFPVAIPAAACADRLDLVDAAYARPGGPQAERLKLICTTGCPIAAACLTMAMTQREEGVWGGTSDGMRTRHGGPATKRTAAARRAKARAQAA